jgi:EAL domain-containing protein (putative c-di-GMP-specific phosphodiesterase class I)
MDYHNNSKVLLPHLVDAFKQIGFSITAEGIETTEMAESMAELGCDYLQGFLYSRPIPMEEFVEKYS